MVNNPVKEAIETLYKPIEDIVKTLAGPAAEEIGLTFRDSFRAWRFKRQVRLFKRVQEICAESEIRPQAVKLQFLFDVVDKATLEEDDELQNLWANLLANAADSREQVLVKTAFPEILKQISKEEALYLLELLEVAQKTEMFVLNAHSFEFIQNEPEHKPKLDAISYDNLKRLGLIELNTETIPAASRTLTKEEVEAGAKSYQPLTEEEYLLSSLGFAFILACQAPKDQSQYSRAMATAASSRSL
jgi:hypothetical protein